MSERKDNDRKIMKGSSASILGDMLEVSGLESEEKLSEDASYEPDEEPKQRKVSGKGTAVFIPADIFKSQKLTSIATRIKSNSFQTECLYKGFD